MSLSSSAPAWCPRTTDEALLTVAGLHPPGPVWDGVHTAGTVQNAYWRAFSSVLANFYSRTCDYVDEFFCATVNESKDQWIEEYGLNDPCDPYGNNLCLKVAAHGGATCADFVSTALLSGWRITCHDTSQDPEPIAGCFQAGCTPLGPVPTYIGRGSTIGYGQRGFCDYGEVVEHPDPSHWMNGLSTGSICPVPGSNLGYGPEDDEPCCFLCGYYTFSDPVPAMQNDYCQSPSNTIYFDCPRTGIQTEASPCPQLSAELRGTDDTGNYSEWGNAYVWEVTINIAASQAAQVAAAPATPPDESISAAGNFMVGLPLFTTDGSSAGGAQLCYDSSATAAPAYALCFLDRIKPAHTTLLVHTVNQP